MIVVFVVGIAAGTGIGYMIAPSDSEGNGGTPSGPLEIGVVMWWHHDEGVWSPSHADAIESLQGKYNLEIHWIEETGLRDVEQVIRNAADKYEIVYVETDEFSEAVKTVAPNYPDTYFIQEWESDILEEDEFPSNVVALNALNAYKINYLLGAAAGRITETNKLGILLAIAGPRSYRVVSNAFKGGAEYANPDVEVTQVVMDAYSDPMKSRDTVASFDEQGIDIVFVNQDDYAATKEAETRGMYTIMQYRDIVEFYPETLIGCGIWDWEKPLDEVLSAITEGRFEEFREEQAQMMLNLEDRSLDVPTWGNMVSDEVKEYIEDLREKIIDGTVEPTNKTTWEE